MCNEKRSEIIKSLAMGIEPVEIAKLEDVGIADVQAISVDCMDEILEIKVFIKRKGCD